MIKNHIINILKRIINLLGFDVKRHKKFEFPKDFSELSINICKKVKPFTMTSYERINSLVNAVQYIVKNDIKGAIVECGVWKGGSSMAIALTLKELNSEHRELYLYDTFSGMSAPSDVDISTCGESAQEEFSRTKISEDSSNWCLSNLDEVKGNMNSTAYNKDNIHFIEGKVEETIPKTIPNEIALLRLDTDWYQSTKHELIHLFPLLKKNGVLIIDDYGYWQGAKKAVDEYLSEKNVKILLNRIDYTGRIAVKT